MNRGVARRATFFGDEDRVEFERLLAVGHERFGVDVLAYCLMNNHYHLVLHCPQGGLSSFMQYVASVLTRRTNERVGRDGPLFRGRFRSILVTSELQLLATVRYVHRNALDLPTVRSVDGYRWSSHRAFLGYRRRPTWLNTSAVLGIFDDDAMRFHRFVAHEDPPPRRIRIEALPAAVELVASERRDDVAPGVRRTVLLRALARLEHSDDHVRLRRILDVEDGRLLDKALWRAGRRAVDDPWIDDVVSRAFELAVAES